MKIDATDGSAGLTLEQATLQAQQECAAEEEAALVAINKEMDDQLKALAEAQLGEIKNRYVPHRCACCFQYCILVLNSFDSNLFPERKARRVD